MERVQPVRAPWHLLLLTLVLVAAIVVPFLLFGDTMEAWTRQILERAGRHRALSAALLGGLLAVDVAAPVPSSLVSTACGIVCGFVGGALLSFAGMTLSAAAGYALGRLAAPAARRRVGEDEARLLSRMQARWGVWMLAAARPVPVLSEASVILAGLAGVPWRRALFPVLAANLGVSAVYAAVGAWAARTEAVPLAFAAAVLLSGIVLVAAGPAWRA